MPYLVNGHGAKKVFLQRNKDPNQSHKILQFQILKASVRAYKNNLNTHNAYQEFREARAQLRQENKQIIGLAFNQVFKKLCCNRRKVR